MKGECCLCGESHYFDTPVVRACEETTRKSREVYEEEKEKRRIANIVDPEECLP